MSTSAICARGAPARAEKGTEREMQTITQTETAPKTATFTYEGALRDALKVQWKVEDILPSTESLDLTRRFLPDALAGTDAIGVLTPAEQLKLNQLRGKTYLYLFGFVEEFILPFVLDQVRATVHGASGRTRALVTFAEEEAKHIDLFRRFDAVTDRALGAELELIGPPAAVAAKILEHSVLGVALTTLHIEWMTQQHYLESVRDDAGLEPHFASLLRHHWQEEAQHAKLDTLLVQEIVARSTPAEIARGFSDYLSIAGILDGGLAAQVQFDVDALERLSGRVLSTADRAEVVAAQHRSYRKTFLVMGARHPSFVATLAAIAPDALPTLAEVVRQLEA
jgi:hypothetical protein